MASIILINLFKFDFDEDFFTFFSLHFFSIGMKPKRIKTTLKITIYEFSFYYKGTDSCSRCSLNSCLFYLIALLLWTVGLAYIYSKMFSK